MTTIDTRKNPPPANLPILGSCQPDEDDDKCMPNECHPLNMPAATAAAFADACPPDFTPCKPVWCVPLDKAHATVTPKPAGVVAATFLWFDLTRKCPLECLHCYNSSGPAGGHGTMSRADWLTVLDQAKAMGVGMVQFIGGEPTMHPHFVELLTYALSLRIRVEVYSNLVHIKDEWWGLFQQPGVSLATSYYSDDPAEHNAITQRPSHDKTLKNVARAKSLGIPLRAGVVSLSSEQRSEQAVAQMNALGITRVGVDRVRAFGRGQREHTACDVNELCGNCGNGRASIGPDGTVSMCIMSGFLPVGNVKTAPLADILAGEEMAAARAKVPVRVAAGPCDPGAQCAPDAYPCRPDNE